MFILDVIYPQVHTALQPRPVSTHQDSCTKMCVFSKCETEVLCHWVISRMTWQHLYLSSSKPYGNLCNQSRYCNYMLCNPDTHSVLTVCNLFYIEVD
jgi:hypothetical protein